MSSTPRLIDLSKVTDDFFWAFVRSDGADIRITDTANAEVPMHVLHFDKDNRQGLISVLADDAGIRLWSGTRLTEAAAEDAVTGQFAVYDSNTVAFWPLIGDGADVTENGHDLTETSSGISYTSDDDLVPGISVATQDGVNPGVLQSGASFSSGGGLTIEMWYRTDSGTPALQLGESFDGTLVGSVGAIGEYVQMGTGGLASYTMQRVDNNSTTGNTNANVVISSDGATGSEIGSGWQHLVAILPTNAAMKVVLNGVETDGAPQWFEFVTSPSDQYVTHSGVIAGNNTNPTTPFTILGIRVDGAAVGLAGKTTLVSVHNVARSVGWAQARYNSLTNPTVSVLTRSAWPN